MNAVVRAVIGAVVTGVCGVAGGCYSAGVDGGEPEGAVVTRYEGTVHGSHLRGELGPVDVFAGDAEATIEHIAWSAGGHSTVRLDRVDPTTGRWAMVQLDLSARLDGPELAPGRAYSATAEVLRTRALETGGPVVSHMLGCAGPARDSLEYDKTPERVDVHVEPGAMPGRRILLFTAHFARGDGTEDRVDGSVEYWVLRASE